MKTIGRWMFSVGLLTAATVALPARAATTETDCSNKLDDDGDGLADCGDADCEKTPACAPDGNPENTNARCSDFVDNDKNGHIDCDDDECNSGLVTVCKGSWTDPAAAPDDAAAPSGDDLPELGAGQSVEDLIGKGSDKDGERNEYLCSDGIDNDGDGRIDCADFGCRFDPDVKVCQGNPGMRFSIIANITGEYEFETKKPDVAFSKIQLRTFGPMPLIPDSFYYLSMRAEKTPRLTFAMFQVPMGRTGHFINVNSGGGGLSNALVLSSSKHLLIDPPFYLTSAFDQGNSAAVEVFGPIDNKGITNYRAYAAGGAGLSTGNVGGRYFGFDNTNFIYGAGLAFQFNVFGNYSRWDSEFPYTSMPLTWAFGIGAKYDVRAQERYVAENIKTVVRWSRIAFSAETFLKQEFEFDSMSYSYNVQLGVLLVEKYLVLAADFGEFIAGDMKNAPLIKETELKRQLDELQWRAALHVFFFKNIGLASLLYSDRDIAPSDPAQADSTKERKLSLEIQYRF